MASSGESFQVPAGSKAPEEDDPLRNLSSLRFRMDSLHDFLSHTVSTNTLIGQCQLDMVSDEISSAIRHVILAAAALLAHTSNPNLDIFDDVKLRSTTDTVDPCSLHNRTDPKFVENFNDVKFKSMIHAVHSNSVPNSVDLKFAGNFDHAKLISTADTEDLTENEQIETKLELEEAKNESPIEDCDVIELDSVELLAEHVHFCEICGKGFKRDANLRMHMRAHGNQFKTPKALAKPESKVAMESTRISNNTRFSCPYVGCNRNRKHKKFRPLKSAICVKNHFKRSHCPKMYSCNRCNKKSFSVLANLKSHLKHCGKAKWKCSCGTTFSRKDKLFGHVALFEGHMPAVGEEEEKGVSPVVMIDDDDEDEDRNKEGLKGDSCLDSGLFDGLLDGFGDTIDGYNLQDVLGMGSPSGLGTSMNEFFNF